MEPPDKGKRIRSFHERVPNGEEREKRASVILSPRMDSPTAPGSELKDFLNSLLLDDKNPDAQQSYKFYSGAPSSALNIISHLPKARLAPTREDDSPVWVFPDGANESEAETILADHVAVQSLSTYPRNMKTGKRYGSPNADFYGLGLYRNRYLSVVADGCGWGPDAAESARDATAALLKYLEQHHCKATDLQSVVYTLLRALAQGAAAVKRGATTLLASVLAEVRTEDIPIVGSEWVYLCVSIGDCKALVYQPATGRLRDVTAGNRAGSNSPVDPGGSLAVDSDLRNLGCYYGTCNKDDIVIMVSDGVHDNFDPQQLGFTPQELKLDIDDWETKAITEAIDKVRTKFRLAVMGQKLVGAATPEAVTQVLIQHCIETTRRSRIWMEQHPNHRLPKDYRAFPGKQDHTSCLAIRVSKVAIDDQLQFKIDEKMRQLHRKEMQAHIAAKYQEAARTRQVLNSALFSRSLNVKSTTVAKAPRLQDVRQSTFTQLGSPAPAIIKTQKSRSLVDVRPRSHSGEVHPSWSRDPARASPSRLERVTMVPPLRTEMIQGEPKPQMAQSSGSVAAARTLQRADPAYLSRSDGLVQTDSQGVIRSASIPRIVEQLVLWFRGPDTPGIVAEQRDCFLLCYKLYCTPRQLLDIIRSLYMRPKPPEVSDEAWRRHTSQLRAGLADLISRWLALAYAVDFWADDGTINYILYEQLMETIEMFPSDEKSPAASPSKRLKDQLPKLPTELPSPKHEKEKKKQKETSSSKGAFRQTFSELISRKLPRPEEIKFVDLNVSDISEHLTFIDYELFSRVTRQEVLSYSTTRPMSAIRSWQHRGELVRRWVATEFITTVNVKQRTVVLDRFARIAERCFEFGNYHCCHEILNGLDHPAVQKLLTHYHIPQSPLAKQLHKAMEGYQDSLNERMRTGKYAIPSLRFYLRKMDELAKVPPTDPERPDNLLFEKMHGLGRILTEIIALQSLPFSKVEDESPNDKAIKMYLMTLDARVRLDRELDVAARQEEANASIN